MFSLLFIAFLLADVLLRLWLASRQIRHVVRHRDHVPEAFAARIGLHSHQRAAGYTVAKMRLSIVERLVEAAVLVGFTLLGGLQFLVLQLGYLFANEVLRPLAL